MKMCQLSIAILLLMTCYYSCAVFAQDYTEWELPNGAKKRLGKGEITGNIIFSPDNSRIAVSSSIGVWLYSASTGKEQNLFTNHSRSVTSVSFSPDGNTLASSSSGEFLLWDVHTGELITVLSAHADEITDLEFSPDGKILATCSWNRDSSVKLWDVDTGSIITTLEGHEDDVTCLEFSPDGKILATGGYDYQNTIKLWDVNNGTLIKAIPTFSLHGSFGVPDISFSPDGKTLASCEGRWNTSIHLWDVETGSLIQTLLGHMIGVNSIDYNQDGSILSSVSDDGILCLWDMNTMSHMNTRIAHTSSAISVAFSHDGHTLVSGSMDGTIHLWDSQTLEKRKTINNHLALWSEIDFSPDGETVASIGRDNTLRLLDITTGKLINTGHGQFDPLTSVSYSPDGRTIATGSETSIRYKSIWNANEDSVRLWDVTTGKTKAILYGHQNNVSYVAFHPYEPIVAASVNKGPVILWDTKSYQPLWTIPPEFNTTKRIAFSPNGRILATGNISGIKLWDFSTRLLITDIPQQSAIGTNIVFSPDGRLIASVSGSLKVNIWDISTGERTIITTGHTDRLVNITFSPDGKSIISAGAIDDGTIRIWDTSNGELKSILTGMANGIDDLEFSPDGNTLATLGVDGTILFWDYSSFFSSQRIEEDVNNDGVVDVNDLVFIAANFGQTGENAADVNGDNIVDIADLIKVAGVLNDGNGAPGISKNINLMTENIHHWLIQAQQLNLSDPITQKGIHFLEQFLLQLKPTTTTLLPNYPNPFNPETWIPYQLSEPSDVSIRIYSADGIVVRNIALGHQQPGLYHDRTHAAYWDGKNEAGEPVASGIYFYTLTTGQYTATRKMTIQK